MLIRALVHTHRRCFICFCFVTYIKLHNVKFNSSDGIGSIFRDSCIVFVFKKDC